MLFQGPAEFRNGESKDDDGQVISNLRMVGLDLETQGKTEEYRSQPGFLPVGIDDGGNDPRHKGDGHHLGVVPDLDNLHIVGTEGDGDGSDNGKRNLDSESQKQEESSDQRNQKVAGRPSSGKKKFI